MTGRFLLGILACAVVMIPSYIGFWLAEIGGLAGMMNDDSYPSSIVIVPIVAVIFSGIVFWIAVFPIAYLARWISKKCKLSFRNGGLIALCLSALLGGLFGLLSGGINAALMYAGFLAIATVIFWITALSRATAPRSRASDSV